MVRGCNERVTEGHRSQAVEKTLYHRKLCSAAILQHMLIPDAVVREVFHCSVAELSGMRYVSLLAC